MKTQQLCPLWKWNHIWHWFQSTHCVSTSHPRPHGFLANTQICHTPTLSVINNMKCLPAYLKPSPEMYQTRRKYAHTTTWLCLVSSASMPLLRTLTLQSLSHCQIPPLLKAYVNLKHPSMLWNSIFTVRKVIPLQVILTWSSLDHSPSLYPQVAPSQHTQTRPLIGPCTDTFSSSTICVQFLRSLSRSQIETLCLVLF